MKRILVTHLWFDSEADESKPVQCGWLKDRYGLSWQIVPQGLGEMMADTDPQKGERVMKALLQRVKLDIGALNRAYANG